MFLLEYRGSFSRRTGRGDVEKPIPLATADSPRKLFSVPASLVTGCARQTYLLMAHTGQVPSTGCRAVIADPVDPRALFPARVVEGLVSCPYVAVHLFRQDEVGSVISALSSAGPVLPDLAPLGFWGLTP